MLRRRVIERELFPQRNFAQREEEHMAVAHAAKAIRLARVIDESGRIATAAGIDAPAFVEFANPHLSASRDAARGFAVADPLALEFTHLFSSRQCYRRETALSIDARFLRHQLCHGHACLLCCRIIPGACDKPVVHLVDRKGTLRALALCGSPEGTLAKRDEGPRLHHAFRFRAHRRSGLEITR